MPDGRYIIYYSFDENEPDEHEENDVSGLKSRDTCAETEESAE